jgi:hypothetical protein
MDILLEMYPEAADIESYKDAEDRKELYAKGGSGIRSDYSEWQPDQIEELEVLTDETEIISEKKKKKAPRKNVVSQMKSVLNSFKSFFISTFSRKDKKRKKLRGFFRKRDESKYQFKTPGVTGDMQFKTKDLRDKERAQRISELEKHFEGQKKSLKGRDVKIQKPMKPTEELPLEKLDWREERFTSKSFEDQYSDIAAVMEEISHLSKEELKEKLKALEAHFKDISGIPDINNERKVQLIEQIKAIEKTIDYKELKERATIMENEIAPNGFGFSSELEDMGEDYYTGKSKEDNIKKETVTKEKQTITKKEKSEITMTEKDLVESRPFSFWKWLKQLWKKVIQTFKKKIK